MKLMNIEKPECLFEKLDGLVGDVDMVFPDGNHYDWAKEGPVVKSLWTTMPDRMLNNVEINLSKGEDTVSMIDFLIRGDCA